MRLPRKDVWKGCGILREELHYFVNTNGSQGFSSFFKSNFGALRQVIRLEDYPAPLVEEVIGRVCETANEKGYQIEVIHNCLDNRPEGVILPQFQSGLMNIPAYVDYGYSVYRLFDNPQVQDIRDHLLKAHGYFAQAKKIHDEWEEIYISHMNFSRLNQFGSETILELLGGHTRNRKGTGVHRFFGAATKDGPVDYIENLTENLEHRYFIKGRPGTGKSTFLKKLAERAIQNGFRVEIYHCSFDPGSLDLVVVRELGMGFFDSTAPHEYFPSRDTDTILDFYSLAAADDVDAEYADKIAQLQAQYAEQVGLAKEEIRQANYAKNGYESQLFDQINPKKFKTTVQKILKKLFYRE